MLWRDDGIAYTKQKYLLGKPDPKSYSYSLIAFNARSKTCWCGHYQDRNSHFARGRRTGDSERSELSFKCRQESGEQPSQGAETFVRG